MGKTSPFTVVEHAQPLSLSLSSLMLPAHLCLEKGRARVLTLREIFFTFAFFLLLPGGALPFFFYLQPAMA
jgi:hypothetical protein